MADRDFYKYPLDESGVYQSDETNDQQGTTLCRAIVHYVLVYGESPNMTLRECVEDHLSSLALSDLTREERVMMANALGIGLPLD